MRGRYFFAPDGTPHYPGLHCFGSRNWTTQPFELDGIYGEQPGPQKYDKGSWPVRFPDPKLLGSALCIQDGNQTPPPPTVQGPLTFYYPDNLLACNYAAWISPDFFDFTVAQNWLDAHDPFISLDGWLSNCPPIYHGNGSIIWALTGTPPPVCETTLYGVPLACWTVPPGVICASGGEAQGGAAGWGSAWIGSGGEAQAGAAQVSQGSAWSGSGGEAQAGAGQLAQGSAWSGSGGEKESGAAFVVVNSFWSGSGGEKESGAADEHGGSAWSGSGGEKESGSAFVVVTSSWSGSGGEKESGASAISSTGTLYFQSTNVDTACEGVLSVYQDLGLTVGSGTTGMSPPLTSFGDLAAFDKLFTGISGAFAVSVNCTGIANATFNFRLQILNSSCTVLLTTASSANFTTTGVKTLSGTLTWPSGGVRVRVVFNAKKNSGIPGSITITDNSSSYAAVQF